MDNASAWKVSLGWTAASPFALTTAIIGGAVWKKSVCVMKDTLERTAVSSFAPTIAMTGAVASTAPATAKLGSLVRTVGTWPV